MSAASIAISNITVTITCIDCEVVCENREGSTMIIVNEDRVVQCPRCHVKYSVPRVEVFASSLEDTMQAQMSYGDL